MSNIENFNLIRIAKAFFPNNLHYYSFGFMDGNMMVVFLFITLPDALSILCLISMYFLILMLSNWFYLHLEYLVYSSTTQIADMSLHTRDIVIQQMDKSNLFMCYASMGKAGLRGVIGIFWCNSRIFLNALKKRNQNLF